MLYSVAMFTGGHMIPRYIEEAIRKIDPQCNARHVFGFMLLPGASFGNMSTRDMNREIRLGIACAKESPTQAESNAKSFGL
jgi:hypothetical protein